MGDWLLGALGLMLIFEGLLPFASPARWRRMFEQVLKMNDGQIRFIGLLSLGGGLLLLAFAA
jgi:uncharacterized protein